MASIRHYHPGLRCRDVGKNWFGVWGSSEGFNWAACGVRIAVILFFLVQLLPLFVWTAVELDSYLSPNHEAESVIDDGTGRTRILAARHTSLARITVTAPPV